MLGHSKDFWDISINKRYRPKVVSVRPVLIKARNLFMVRCPAHDTEKVFYEDKKVILVRETKSRQFRHIKLKQH